MCLKTDSMPLKIIPAAHHIFILTGTLFEKSIYHRDYCTSQWLTHLLVPWYTSTLEQIPVWMQKVCLVYDLYLEYDLHARTCINQNES